MEKAFQDAERNSQVKTWLGKLTPAESRKLIEGWCVRDGTTVEERRAALAQMVERIEFDPSRGEGRVHYRIGLNGERFRLKTAANELGLCQPGFRWRPHREPPFSRQAIELEFGDAMTA